MKINELGHQSGVFFKSMSRCMKSLKLENHIILVNFIKETRPISEQGVVVWNTGLTKRQI